MVVQAASLHDCGPRVQNGVMNEVWTHGTWTVTPGRESDFVRAWEELGDWTVREFPGSHPQKNNEWNCDTKR